MVALHALKFQVIINVVGKRLYYYYIANIVRLKQFQVMVKERIEQPRIALPGFTLFFVPREQVVTPTYQNVNKCIVVYCYND